VISGSGAGSRTGVLARYGLLDRRLIGWSILWTAAVLASYGLVSAIVPNPVFGRGIPPGAAAVAVWLASAPLMGFVIATYFAPPAATEVPLSPIEAREPAGRGDGKTLGTAGSVAAFLAIGCPTCNKIALLLLGTSGAANVFGSVQPFLGALSLAMLAVTAAWRLRLRTHGAACPVAVERPAIE
jgi:hypothetical protein